MRVRRATDAESKRVDANKDRRTLGACRSRAATLHVMPDRRNFSYLSSSELTALDSVFCTSRGSSCISAHDLRPSSGEEIT